MRVFYVPLLAVLLLSACSKNNNSSPSGSGETDFSVYLTDDPAEYDEVNIDIQRVDVHFADAENDSWYTLKKINPGVQDLLRLSNGKDTLLATDRISAKKVTQIRLILGENNTIVVDGVTYPLETPSAEQSGLKLIINAELTEGIEYKVWTDFDASKSIVETGNGKYILKPVIRVYIKAIAGAIQGIVQPPAADAWVYAIQGSDTIASAKPDPATGYFAIHGLGEGEYTISVDGSNGYNDAVYDNVGVTIGNVSDIGTVKLEN